MVQQRNNLFLPGREFFLKSILIAFAAVVITTFTAGLSWAAASKVATGYDHSMVIRSDGTLWIWGANQYGQVGDGTSSDRLTPFRIAKGSDWAAIAAGKFYSLAVRSDGTLWAWGSNAYGQLGDGTTIDRHAPVQIGTDTDWAFVSAGIVHTVAIKSNGTLWAWGRNQAGQLGDGMKTDQLVPIQIGTDSDWAMVSPGTSHTVALKSDGTLWAWGANDVGQLGNGTTIQESTPVRIGTDPDWAAVDGGDKYTLALRSDGSLWAWGNTLGLLPVRFGTDSNWAAVSANADHSLGLKTDGTIWGWGSNTYGQLGNGTTIDSLVPVQAGPGTEWKAAATGDTHTVAIATDNGVWAWGNNAYGQLGDGTTAGRLSPAPISVYTVTPADAINGSITPSTPLSANWGASLTFTITPDDGYQIESVTGCDGTLSGTSFTTGPVTADCSVSATFIKIWTITAVAGANGSINPSGVVIAAQGSTTSFTVTPDTGYKADSVTGCNGTLSGKTFVTGPIAADCTVNATFVLKTYIITATAGTNGSISPSGDVVVAHGSSQSFTSTPVPGYHVETVQVDGVIVGPFRPMVIGIPLGDPYTYTISNVTAPHTINASFAPNPSVTITATAGPNGTISPSGSVTFLSETDKTFTITPAAGYLIADVLVDGVSAGVVNSYTFTKVMTNHTIDARFAPAVNYVIQAVAGPNGTISPAGEVIVPGGTSKSFRITANSGYRVADVQVDGASMGALASYTFYTVTADHSITVSFSPTIVSTRGANGSIYPQGTTVVTPGSDLSFTMTPSAGYHIEEVLVDGVPIGPVVTPEPPLTRPYTYTFTNVTVPHTISVTFAPNPTMIITASAGQNGTITPSGEVGVLSETNKLFKITPDSGYRIADVQVDGGSVGAVTSYQFVNITVNHSISATFSPTIVSTKGANGSIYPQGTTAVSAGSDQSYTMTPSAGYHIEEVLVDGVPIGPVVTPEPPLTRPYTYTFTNVTVPHTISVTFAPNPAKVITASAGLDGTITPAGEVAVLSETNKSFKITPASGYRSNVVVDGVSVGALGYYTFYNVTADHAISVTFSPTIVSTKGANGTIYPLGTTAVSPGSSQTYTMTPTAGYHVEEVLVDGVSAGLGVTEAPLSRTVSYTFTNVTVPHTISVTFAPNPTMVITTSAGQNGTISPSGDVPVLSETNKLFKITPASGYRVADVKVDNVSMGALGYYTFYNVTANHTISASFSPTIVSTRSANGTIYPLGTTAVSPGSDQTYTIIPAAGYHVEDVLVDGVSVGAVTTYTFFNVTIPHTIGVTFGVNQ